MLDIGFPEFLLISFVLLIVVGPKDLPKVLRSITSFVRKIKSIKNDVDDIKNANNAKSVKKSNSKIKNV